MLWMTIRGFRYPLFGLFVLALSGLPAACAHHTHSLEDARQVTVSIQQTSLVPPPGRAYGVVELLQRDNKADSRATRKFREAAS